jgi:hypothetical protein
MIDLEKLKVGDKVHYQPDYTDKQENGIVKEIRGSYIFVVYHCDENWEEYQKYTAALTGIKHLKLGWKE